tara:strand:- start:1122 stop:1436 length:315 start_codon:yes stop_codon:yes gene_type:complete
VSFEDLTSQINTLSAQVEALILANDEEQCSELLNQRLALLHQLDLLMTSDKSMLSQYHDFLLSIQHRDRHAIEAVSASQNKILSEGRNQKKRTNAVNAYQKFSE